MKKPISFILILCMVLAMMPMMSITASADAPPSPMVYVGGTNVVSAGDTTYWVNDNSGGITSTGADSGNYTVMCNSTGATPVLTLNGAEITTSGGIATNAAIYSDGDLNIVLQGNNTAVGSGDTDVNSYGIYVNGTLGISGDGALTAKGGKTTGTDVISCGIYCENGVNISSGAITALGGTVTTADGVANNLSCGIIGPVGISGGKVVALGGATNITVGRSRGIYAHMGAIHYTDGLLVAKGGRAPSCVAMNLTAKDEHGADVVAKAGLYSGKYVVYYKNDTYSLLEGNQTPAGNITLNNTIIVGQDIVGDTCALTITNGGKVSLDGFNVILSGDSGGGNGNAAVYGSGEMTIEGSGALIAVGGTSTSGTSEGILGWFPRLNIKGGNITAIGGASSDNSYGVNINTDFYLSGGHLTAIGGACGGSKVSAGVDNGTDFSGSAKGVAIGDSKAYADATAPTYAVVKSGSWTGKVVSWEGLPKSATPLASVTTVNKTAATQTSVPFTLTNDPAYADSQTWKVYESDTATTTVSGVTATNAGNTLTLAHATDLPAGTYYVSVTETGEPESFRLALTVGSYVPPSNNNSSGGSSAPTLVTKIESGGNVTDANVGNLVKEGKSLTVEGKTGEKLVFDTEALKSIDGQTKDSVKVEIKDVSADHKNEHPGKLVVSLSITAGGKHITSFGNGTATVSLPYELKAGEKATDVTVWYLAEDGTMTEVPCTYDPATKLATFKVNHFSLYVVGTADTSKWVNPYSDVKESSWYYDAVRYVSANEMMNGTTDTTFNPGAKTNRGMIVTILWRMENEPKASKDMTFTDVKDGRYYHDAVAWASEKGIVGGYSAEQFAPENNITREQLAVILHNYASFKGYTATASGDLSVFGDSGSVHSWAKDSMSWANGQGLIKGSENNLLDPAGAAQRSQVAAILQRFVENIVK